MTTMSLLSITPGAERAVHGRVRGAEDGGALFDAALALVGGAAEPDVADEAAPRPDARLDDGADVDAASPSTGPLAALLLALTTRSGGAATGDVVAEDAATVAFAAEGAPIGVAVLEETVLKETELKETELEDAATADAPTEPAPDAPDDLRPPSIVRGSGSPAADTLLPATPLAPPMPTATAVIADPRAQSGVPTPAGATAGAAPADQIDDDAHAPGTAASVVTSRADTASTVVVAAHVVQVAAAGVSTASATEATVAPLAQDASSMDAPPPATSTAPSIPLISSVITTAPPELTTAPARAVAVQVSPVVLSIAQRPTGTHQLTMTVNPESLGPVTVRAHIGPAGDVRVELVGGTDAGREALRTIVADLRRDLTGTMPNATLSLGSPVDADAGTSERGMHPGGDGPSGQRSDRHASPGGQLPHVGVDHDRLTPTTIPAAPGAGLDILV